MLTKKRSGETFEEVITKLGGAAPPCNLNREEKQKLLQQICYSLISGHPYIRYAHGLLLEKLVIDTFFPEWAEGIKNSRHLLKARYEKGHYFIARNAYYKKNHGVHVQPLRLAVEKFWEAFDFDPILYNMDGAQIRVGIWGRRASEAARRAELERQRQRDAQGPDLQLEELSNRK